MFISDKLAEEITLTIGQAFELAYKRFLETSGKDLEAQQKAIIIQQKIKKTEQDLNVYKKRLLELSELPSIKAEIEAYLRKKGFKNVLDVGSMTTQTHNHSSQKNGQKDSIETADIIDFNCVGKWILIYLVYQKNNSLF